MPKWFFFGFQKIQEYLQKSKLFLIVLKITSKAVFLLFQLDK